MEKQAIGIKFHQGIVCEYLFVFLLIFQCRSIFMHTDNKPSWLNYAIVLFFGITVLFSLNKVLISSQELLEVVEKIVLIWIFLGIFIIIRPQNVSSLLRIGIILSLFFIFYTFHCKNNGYSIMLKYRNIIFILAVISLIFWFFGFVLGWLKPMTSVISTWTGTPKIQEMFFYLSGSTQNISIFSIEGIPRNTSIFTEAPMASLHFSLAFIFEEFKNPSSKGYVKLVLIIAILSTFSTTGYMVLVLSLMFRIFGMKANTRWLKVIKYISVVVCVFVGSFILYYLLNGKLDTGSGNSRLSDFTTGFNYWSQNFFWGYGFNYDEINGTGYSNSIIPIVLSGGLYALALYLYMIIKGVYNSVRIKDWDGLIFIGLLLFVFAITIVPFQYLTFFVLMYIASKPQNTNRSSATYIHAYGTSK